jgi:hypothetical protein
MGGKRKEEDDVGPAPPPAGGDDDAEDVGPAMPPPKKKKSLPFEQVYLDSLPCTEMYEKSYMVGLATSQAKHIQL